MLLNVERKVPILGFFSKPMKYARICSKKSDIACQRMYGSLRKGLAMNVSMPVRQY